MISKDIFKGNIQIGQNTVVLRIFIDPRHNSYNKIKSFVENYYNKYLLEGGFENFLDNFNKLIVPVIIYIFKEDQLLRESSNFLKKIEVMICPDKGAVAAVFVLSSATPSFVPFKLHITDRILNIIKDYTHKGKFNSSDLMHTLEHEITHFFNMDSSKSNQLMIQNLGLSDLNNISKLSSSKFYPIAGLLSTLSISEIKLLVFLSDIKNEGEATFRTFEHRQRIPVQSKVIRMYGGKFAILSENEDFTKKSKSMLYIIGAYMWTIIALMLLNKTKNINKVKIVAGDKTIQIYNPEIKQSGKQYLIDECIGKYDSFYFTQLPEEAIHGTLMGARNLSLDQFIKIYNLACDEFSISEKHRIISLEKYNSYRKSLIDNKNKIKELLLKNGFALDS